MAELLTLGDLRVASKLTIRQIIEIGTLHDSTFPQSHAGLLDMEERGTRDWWRIHALAEIYQRTPDEIAEISRPKNLRKNVAIC